MEMKRQRVLLLQDLQYPSPVTTLYNDDGDIETTTKGPALLSLASCVPAWFCTSVCDYSTPY